MSQTREKMKIHLQGLCKWYKNPDRPTQSDNLCYIPIYPTVINDSVNGEQRSWSSCMSLQADLGLCYKGVCLFVLRFYWPVNPMGSCRARSVYLTTRLLGRLSPQSGWPVLCTFFCQKLTTALLESAEGREWPWKIFPDQSPQKNVADLGGGWTRNLLVSSWRAHPTEPPRPCTGVKPIKKKMCVCVCLWVCVCFQIHLCLFNPAALKLSSNHMT